MHFSFGLRRNILARANLNFVLLEIFYLRQRSGGEAGVEVSALLHRYSAAVEVSCSDGGHTCETIGGNKPSEPDGSTVPTPRFTLDIKFPRQFTQGGSRN